MADTVSILPTEVELALEVMPCQAMRRSYDSNSRPHPCAYFAEWGFLHSFDYSNAGPPPTPGIRQGSVYRGKRQLVPEILSGCRKAPIVCVGINPNMPGWTEASRNAVHPYFEDYLQYAHYFRYRNTAKLRIPKDDYVAALAGRGDKPSSSEPLVADRSAIPIELDPVTMYKAYQSLLDGLAARQGWVGHKLSVGEDISYANMVACGSVRWVVRPNPNEPDMPVMGDERADGIVQECFHKRRYFLRQLAQSLANVVLVFSATTAVPFITALQNRFRPQGAPSPNEKIADLIKREIRLEYGHLDDGTLLDARVIFLPHASARPDEFAAVKEAAIAQMSEEVAAGRLVFDAPSGHLVRPRGGCFFCSNALYRIGPCDYESQLKPLAPGAVSPLAAPPGQRQAIDPLKEKEAQARLLDALVRFPGDVAKAGIAAAAGAAIVPLDTAAPSAPALVLLGKVVSMAGEPVDQAAVYTHRGEIVAVRKQSDPAPEGFENARRIQTDGLIYPGLLDLHNHLAYNILPLWTPPRAFANRSDWMKLADYKRFVSDPMALLVKRRPDLIKSIVRYVETKLLIGGVTSGQGMNSRFGGEGLYKGIVRNFESSGDDKLPSALHQVPDLRNSTEDIEKFRAKIQSLRPFFFHLAEGSDQRAREQFLLLKREELFAKSLIAIHCVGLRDDDFEQLARKGGRVVWSPLSNLLLYGRTLDFASLARSGADFSLGSDWTPSGSRNILLELKVARLTAEANGWEMDSRRLAHSVTRVAAEAAGWGGKLGTIEAGKYADLLVLDASSADPYDNLALAMESNIRLVMVAGHLRFGDEAIMGDLSPADQNLEPLTVGGRRKALRLEHPSSPLNGLSLGKASATLREEMSDLARAELKSLFMPFGANQEASIELDLQAEADETDMGLAAAAPPLNSIPLDPLTVVDDPAFFDALDQIAHLPAYLKGSEGLRKFYL